MVKISSDPESFGEIIKKNKQNQVKAPAYPWQDMALKIINELGIPVFKRSSVFKICKTNPREFVLMAMNDTKELCHGEDAWKYFFKIIGDKGKKIKR